MKSSKILLSLLIGAALMIGVGSWIGSGIVQPVMYHKAIKSGAEHLQKQDYEKALAQFQRSVSLYGDTTQGRLGMAYAYLGLGNSGQAADILQRAQQEAMTDADFLRECLDVLCVPEPKAAYTMLRRYREAVGSENMPEDLQTMWEKAQSVPEQLQVTPEPDAYASAITVTLNRDEICIGHHYYFTLDGTTPNKKSFSYREPIVLSENTKLAVIGYNAQGEAGEVQTYTYEIDSSLRQKLKRIYSQAVDATSGLKVGEEPGQVSQKGMDKLKKAMYATEKVLALELLTKEEAEKSYQSIGEAFTYFEEEIVPETDKTSLQEQIQKAEQLIRDVGEEDAPEKEIKELKALLQDAKSVYDDRSVTQDEVDDSGKLLRAAIEAVETARQTESQTDDAMNVVLTWTSEENLVLQVVTPAGDTVGSGSVWSLISGGRMRADSKKRDSGGFYSQVSWESPPEGSYEIQISAPANAAGMVQFHLQILSDKQTRSYSGTVQPGKMRTYTFSY